MKPPKAKRDATSWNPNHPHPFQPIDDAGLGSMSAGGFSRGANPLTSIAVTNRYQRTAGCGVPGCGRPRDHELHAPED